MWSLLKWRNGNRIPALFFRCSYPHLPSSQPQPNDTSVNSEGSVQNNSDSKDRPYAIWWHIGGNVTLYWMLLIWGSAEFHKLKYKKNARWHLAGFACQLKSGSCFSKLIMLFLVLTCRVVSCTDSYSVAGKVSFDTNGNDPTVNGLVFYLTDRSTDIFQAKL